jgi:NDP-sugar pyrophosphorylase family protein
MRAVILAGGRGTRLAPYTTVIPKPLLPVGDTPILEVIIRQLAHAGFDHVTLTLGYMREYFAAFLSQNERLTERVKLDMITEEHPTGTAGSLVSVPDLNDTFLVMNGDILSDIDYRALLKFHRDQESWLTIATHPKPIKIDLGVIETNDQHQVTGYIEKPTLHYSVSMGIYVYEPQVLDFITPGEYLDFPTLVLKLVENGKKVSSFHTDAQWLDLGRPEDLQQAAEIFMADKESFLPELKPSQRRVA